MSARWCIAVLAAVALAASVSAETSWAAGAEGSDATYPNQGRRLVKDGTDLHGVYSGYDTSNDPPMWKSYYVHSTNSGTGWQAAEAIDFGSALVTNERDHKACLDIDGNDKPWFTAVSPGYFYYFDELRASVRRSSSNYNYGKVWDETSGDTKYRINTVSAVMSPSGGSSPMVYAVMSVHKYDDTELTDALLFFVPWDTAVYDTPRLAIAAAQQLDSIHAPGEGESLKAAITVSQHPRSGTNYDSIHVVYQKKDGSDFKVYYLKSYETNPSQIRSGGAPSWYGVSEVSNEDSQDAKNPSIAFDDDCDSLFVAWHGTDSNDVWRSSRGFGGSWTTPKNMSSTNSYESDYPTLSTQYVVGWHEESVSNYDIKGWFDGHVETVKSTGGDSTSKYAHVAGVYSASPYWVDCHALWTEQCASSGLMKYKAWYKKYRYVPHDGGQGGWVRLEGSQSLVRAWPNPSYSGFELSYVVPEPGPFRLQVFDIGGCVVRTLAVGDAEPGLRRVKWDGLDARGRPAARGTYYCRLQARSSVSNEVLAPLR